jgi:hypothetical protein
MVSLAEHDATLTVEGFKQALLDELPIGEIYTSWSFSEQQLKVVQATLQQRYDTK